MRGLIIAAALLAAFPALAQQAPTVDPRLAGSMVQALQGQVALQTAVIAALREDQEKKDAELAKWFEGWFPSVAPTAETTDPHTNPADR